MADNIRVAVAGLGSVGLRVARALDDGIAGLCLSAVAASSPESATRHVVGFRSNPCVVPLGGLADQADVVVECLPPAAFGELAASVLSGRGKTLVVASVGCLLTAPDFIDAAHQASVRLIVPSGAVAGLDGLRAAREIGLDYVRLTTRKPPASFGDAIEIDGRRLATDKITEPVRLFCGNARQSVEVFPKNINVAAAIALAGLGSEETQVEIWADPTVTVNMHELFVRSRGGEMRATSANQPDEDNPKSSAITAFSIIAALRRLEAALTIGS